MIAGVIQGGVLSPGLFNYYLADFPTPPPIIKLIKYAENIAIYTSGPVVADQVNCLTIYLPQVLDYINNNKQTVSTAKSTVTLFTPDTHDHYLHPQVKLADQVLPLEQKPNMIGVMLDTHLTFTQHYNNIAVIAQKRNNVLKALTGSTCGCDKETLKTPYKPIGRSVLSYCCLVWKPSNKDTNWSRLQRAQYYALIIATGCHKIADVVKLHQEARELPVGQHNDLILQKFAMACHQPQHSCHQLCHRPPDDRPDRR